MTWQILRSVASSRLARMIGTVLAALAAVLTFGAIRKREGVTEERAREAQRDAADFAETIERVTDETATAESIADIRARLRARAKR